MVHSIKALVPMHGWQKPKRSPAYPTHSTLQITSLYPVAHGDPSSELDPDELRRGLIGVHMAVRAL